MSLSKIKKMVESDFDVEDVLEALADEGYCPAIVCDDNGLWALAMDGMQSVRSDPEDYLGSTFFIDADLFKGTIREAIKYGVSKL